MFSAQIYFSVHKYVFQCTNIFSSAQMYFSVHKYVFQCTNIFSSAQIYLSVHKCIFQGTNMFHCTIKFPSAQNYSCTKWVKNGRKTLGLHCHWGLVAFMVALFAALSIGLVANRSHLWLIECGGDLRNNHRIEMLKIWMICTATIFKKGLRTKICCCFY